MSEPMQFDVAEFGAEGGAGANCAACRQPVRGVYFEMNGQVTCEACRQEIEQAVTQGSGVGRFLQAAAWGAAGGAAGAGIWYAVRAAFHLEIGLIAIVVGLLVGGGVRKGSRGRGGWVYQVLALVLTYSAVVSTHVPELIAALGQDRHDRGLVVSAVMLAVAFAAPFLSGRDNAIGIVIIGIALYEAWKMNRRTELRITGPYRVADQAANGTTG